MRAMLTTQGTAMAETALCEQDFTNETARVNAHRAALMATDAGDYTWQDVTGNDALSCQECGESER